MAYGHPLTYRFCEGDSYIKVDYNNSSRDIIYVDQQIVNFEFTLDPIVTREKPDRNKVRDSETFVNFTSPDEGTTLQETPLLKGTTEEGGTVTLSINGKELFEVDVDESGKWQYEVPEGLSLGEHTVVAKATDESGNTDTDRISFIIDTESYNNRCRG